MPAKLTLYFFFISFHFFLFSFLSFLFPYILFCDSSQMVVTVVLALFFPSCTVRAPFLQHMPLPNFTVLALNHLCLVWVYLPTTIRPSMCHSPSPNKEDYFVCQSAWHPFLLQCGCLLSPYLSWHAPSGSSSTLPVWAVCHSSRTLPPKEP